MDEKTFLKAVSGLALGQVRYHATIASTNDLALAWAAQGAPDRSLVFADEQTSGRGRSGRRWITPPGAALAFSLILRPRSLQDGGSPGKYAGLAALALADVLTARGLQPEIKWPNDVLVRRRKLAGVLVEVVWLGDRVESVVLGMGVNVLTRAVPPQGELLFPATSLEDEGLLVERPVLLREILSALLARRENLDSPAFIRDWEQTLAFRGEAVRVWRDGQEPLQGVVTGLAEDGSLRLRLPDGSTCVIAQGELHLRPVKQRL